jgi:hypothetical protein
VVLAVVPLWNGQLDLAIEQGSVEKVNDQFKNFTRYRLEVFDSLFLASLAESGFSQEQTALRALKGIRSQYWQRCCTAVPDEPGNRTRIEKWFAAETKDPPQKKEDLKARVSIHRN